MLLVSYSEPSHHLGISCDTLSNLLYQHETDFKQLNETDNYFINNERVYFCVTIANILQP